MILRALQSFASLFCLLTGSTTVWAQGTIQIGFDGLPPNEILGEQFASKGIHFVTNSDVPPYPASSTTVVPPSLSSVGNTVGLAVDLSMRFDFPVSSISATIAEFTVGKPNYTISGRDSAGAGVPGGNTESFPVGQWYIATGSFSPNSPARSIDLVGWDFTSAQNFRHSFYIDSLEITAVPEPQPFWLLTLGLGAILLRRSKSLKTQSG